MPEFAVELEKMDRLAEQGVQVETAEWEPRSVIYCMGRKCHHTKDESFSSTNPPMRDLVQRISQVIEEVRQGTHTSNREKDVLTQAFGNKEHPGRTRGTSVVA
jgi:DNA-binding ferritin-like protein